MISLRQARDQGNLNKFVDQQELSPTPSDGDEDAFNRALASMAGTSKEVPEASTPERDDG